MKSSKVTDRYLRKKIKMLRKSAAKHRRGFRPGRQRVGLYRYLRDVYQMYLDLRLKRCSKKATRRIAKLFKLSVQRNSHPIRILIEASAGPEDPRQKSRWVQALRYVSGWRQPAEKLKWTFEVNGGISGCASQFAVVNGTTRRKA